MAFEELKRRQSAVWGAALFGNVAAGILGTRRRGS
jgi:hypothetical protein